MNTALMGEVEFPQSKSININMMPFIIGEKESLPKEVRHYHDLVDLCDTDQIGLVGYLTVTESTVEDNVSQRRGGIHTESPGKIRGIVASWGWGGGTSYPAPSTPKPKPKPQGGIFMASNISNSCKVWDDYIETPGKMGDCEHCRELLGDGQLMQKNQLWWMTDKTPHESLPIKAGTHRQFFRLVTNKVSYWFSKHSTPNPLVMPDCPIIYVDKFTLQ